MVLKDCVKSCNWLETSFSRLLFVVFQLTPEAGSLMRLLKIGGEKEKNGKKQEK